MRRGGAPELQDGTRRLPRERARLPAVEVQRRKAHDIAREHVAARERCRILERVAVKDPFVQVGDRLRASRARAG